MLPERLVLRLSAPKVAGSDSRMSDGPDLVQNETGEVRSAHRFDVAALEAYMRANVEGFRGSLTVRQFKGGQSNPTFLLTAGDQR